MTYYTFTQVSDLYFEAVFTVCCNGKQCKLFIVLLSNNARKG